MLSSISTVSTVAQTSTLMVCDEGGAYRPATADEVRRGFGALTAAEEAAVYNPAFDITPAALVSAIVSDRGVHRPPYDFSVDHHFASAVA